MKLELIRQYKQETETIGALAIDDKFFCYTCEDKDRGLRSDMTVEEIKAIKVYGKTAIPTGTYEVVLSYSNRFKKLLPLIVGVKGFEGIRIHPGNFATDSEGCVLPGLMKSINGVTQSRAAMTKFMAVFTKAIKKEKVFITIL